jgi:hypothetical protein
MRYIILVVLFLAGCSQRSDLPPLTFHRSECRANYRGGPDLEGRVFLVCDRFTTVAELQQR